MGADAGSNADGGQSAEGGSSGGGRDAAAPSDSAASDAAKSMGADEGGVDADVLPGALPYMIGFGGSGETNGEIAAGEAALGRVFDLATDGVSVDAFQFGPYISSNGHALAKVSIFEMLSMSWDSDQSLQDMAQAASGAYDGVYTQMAQAMASFGYPTVSARPGHEMNGNW